MKDKWLVSGMRVKRGLLFFVLLLLIPCFTWSHALHPASIDRHADITLSSNKMVLIYEVVLGINATENAARELDPNMDGEISDKDRDRYLQEISAQHAQAHEILLASQPLQLQYRTGDAYSTAGHNGINAIKIDLGYVADIPADIPRGVTIPFSYYDKALTQVPGWKQVSLHTLDGITYSGHIPYSGYRPFDYEILNTKGFAPSTDVLNLQVLIPESPQIEGQPEVQLPPRMIEMDIMRGMVMTEDVSAGSTLFLVTVLFLVLLLLLGGIALWIQWR